MDINGYKCRYCGKVCAHLHILTEHMQIHKVINNIQSPSKQKSNMLNSAREPHESSSESSSQRNYSEYERSEHQSSTASEIESSIETTTTLESSEDMLPDSQSDERAQGQIEAAHQQEKKKGYTCRICKQTLLTRWSLRNHFSENHPEEKPYLCPVCWKTYVRFESLQMCNIKHSGRKPYKCDTCRQKFATRTQRNSHHKKCKANKRNRQEKDMKKLKRGKTPHNHSKRMGYSCTCRICGDKLLSVVSYKRHFITCHPGRKPFKCSSCKKEFASMDDARACQNLHQGIKPYKCNVCAMSFHSTKKRFEHRKSTHKVGFMRNKKNVLFKSQRKITKGKGKGPQQLKKNKTNQKVAIPSSNQENVQRRDERLNTIEKGSNVKDKQTETEQQQWKRNLPQDAQECKKCKGIFLNKEDFVSHFNAHLAGGSSPSGGESDTGGHEDILADVEEVIEDFNGSEKKSSKIKAGNSCFIYGKKGNHCSTESLTDSTTAQNIKQGDGGAQPGVLKVEKDAQKSCNLDAVIGKNVDMIKGQKQPDVVPQSRKENNHFNNAEINRFQIDDCVGREVRHDETAIDIAGPSCSMYSITKAELKHETHEIKQKGKTDWKQEGDRGLNQHEQCENEESPDVMIIDVSGPVTKQKHIKIKQDPDHTLTCRICHAVFPSEMSVTEHFRVYHSGHKPFKCLVCGSTYVQYGDMREHMAKHQVPGT